jgi:N-acetylglucosaminyldiphosphoundecaprenol N-acetyl-beta-D-mannosaminyltransferase
MPVVWASRLLGTPLPEKVSGSDLVLPLGGAMAVTVGASLSFVTGDLRRAPRWMSRVGLEWVYRLASEPRRLWHRYLVRGPRFLSIVARTAREARATRATAR